jgi:sialate O-acetylesterase
MEFTVHTAFNATAEIAAAAEYPSIRVMTVGQGTRSDVPLADLATISQAWARASPASIGEGDWSAFSAVAWFFGRDLFRGLGSAVPIGLVSDNWGGTQIQLWSSPAALAACGWAGGGSSLWNAMIHPLTVGPVALTGFLW